MVVRNINTITIFKGWHYSLALPRIHRGNVERIEYVGCFTEDSKYDLGYEDPDQQDWNKLGGISFGWNHHKESARFGWCYNPKTDYFELSHYHYRFGQVFYNEKYDWRVRAGEPFKLIIEIDKRLHTVNYIYVVNRNEDIVVTKTLSHLYDNSWGFILGFYFGGNEAAPRTLSMKIKRTIVNL